jgi:uncharacterized protein
MQSVISKEMMPVWRDLRFELPPERVCDWHGQGSSVTQFFNALSLQFPDGERFFIESVRNYREYIADPLLKQQVMGFIGQEAMHTREHAEYNALLSTQGIPVQRTQERLAELFNFYRRRLPKDIQLALTVSVEHHTAMLANWLLSNPEIMKGAVEAYAQVWTWHALEETEHKAVAFDVWRAVMKPGLYTYLVRVVTYLLVSTAIWTGQCLIHSGLLYADRRNNRHHLRGLWRTWKLLFTPRRGIFPHCFKESLSFMRPDFHPWDHDNRHLLEQVDWIAAHHKARPVAASKGLHRGSRAG